MLFLVNDLIPLMLKEKKYKITFLKQLHKPDPVLGTLNAYNELTFIKCLLNASRFVKLFI